MAYMLGTKCNKCCKKFKCDSNPSLTSCPYQIDYLWGPEYSNVPQYQEVPQSRQTITVPSELSLPVLVRFCGGADDGFAIDGIRIVGFAANPPDIIMRNRTFVIAVWNDGGPSVGGTQICFFEYNPLP